MIFEELHIIRLLWDGPYSLRKILKNPNQTGLYQIYGTHPIYGRNVLLYIGQTINSFASRFKEHLKWIKYEYDTPNIYIGQLMSKDIEVKSDIEEAEKLLLYNCAPAYNSNQLIEYKGPKNIILMNFGKIGSIPNEVSSLWYYDKVWEESSFFKDNKHQFEEFDGDY